MENLCKRFPHLAAQVFDQVDDQSLNNCKEMNRGVLEHLDNERFFWIRIIKKYQKRLKDFPKLWKPVIDKIPVETVKQIAIAVSEFFQLPHLYSVYADWPLSGDRRKQWSLIAISANHGDLVLLQFIVNKIKLKNVRKTERINALNLAADKGHLEIYKFLSRKLRDKNPGNVSLVNTEGRSPLHWAANRGHFAVCKFIIENTPNKNPAYINPNHTKYRITPLHYAAEFGHVEVCKLIMENLVDKNPIDSLPNPTTPLSRAKAHGKSKVCQLFHENGIH